MRISPEARKTVGFIGYYDQTDLMPRPRATAFFVSREPSSRIYAVTARHSIDQMKKLGVETSVLMVNSIIPGHKRLLIDIPVSDWFSLKEDLTIDIAIAPVVVPNGITKQLAIPFKAFAVGDYFKEWEVELGDEVFVMGLFQHLIETEQNIPIARIGNLAASNEEKVLTKFGKMDAYLIECRSIGGLSGSPVFLNLGHVRRMDGQLKQYKDDLPMSSLLGLIHGHFDVKEETGGNLGSIDLSGSQINTGIAVVTPASAITKAISQFEVEQPSATPHPKSGMLGPIKIKL